jgi:O-methyltransferase
MALLDARNLQGSFFNIVDGEKFQRGFKLMAESLFDGGASMFAADNVITWNRNLSFLRDDFFINILQDKNNSVTEKSCIWRSYILLYFAEMCARLEGDYTEFGCYTGYTADLVTQKVDFKSLGKKYFLYDLFEWKEGDAHTRHLDHADSNMHQKVIDRFADKPYVSVIKGSAPDSFSQGFPEKIAFAHIDMNNPAPEVGALERVLPVLTPGGVIVFDDYGWWGYSAQKMALDPIVEKAGLKILELPTGQGILIKPY